jgi:hypothetical protein
MGSSAFFMRCSATSRNVPAVRTVSVGTSAASSPFSVEQSALRCWRLWQRAPQKACLELDEAFHRERVHHSERRLHSGSGKITVRNQDRQSNRKIKTSSGFLRVCRSKIHGDACSWKGKARTLQRTPNAFTRFLHRGIWKADDDKCGKAGRDVCFDINELCLKAKNRCGANARSHVSTATASRKNINPVRKDSDGARKDLLDAHREPGAGGAHPHQLRDGSRHGESIARKRAIELIVTALKCDKYILNKSIFHIGSNLARERTAILRDVYRVPLC